MENKLIGFEKTVCARDREGEREKKNMYKVNIYKNINNSLKLDKWKSMEYSVLGPHCTKQNSQYVSTFTP